MTENTGKPTAYSYVRMSSQQQLKGDSLRRQLDLSRNYAESHGLELDESLRDIGVSAWTGANVRDGALGRFLNMIETGAIERGSYLLVESLDRLSRERVIDALQPFLSILRAGIIVVTLADNQTYSADSVGENFTQLIISLTIMARAHEESQTKSKRLKAANDARRNKAAAGIGRYSANMWLWLDQKLVGPDKYDYVPNDNAKAVQRIFELADSGLGQIVITRRLNEEGYPTFRKAEAGWQQATVGKILGNEAVIGTYQPVHRVDGQSVPFGPPIPNYLPAVVDSDLFWRVQQKKRIRASSGNSGERFSNLLSGLTSCSHCGSTLRMKDGGSPASKRKYLVCDKRYRARTCDQTSGTMRYDIVEQAILDNVREFMLDPTYNVGAVMASKASIEDAIANEQQTIDTLTRKHRNLMDTLGDTDDREIRLAVMVDMKALNTKIEQAKAQVKTLTVQLETFAHRQREMTDFEDRVKIERLLWTGDDTKAIYDSRAKLHKALAGIIDILSVDFRRKQFTAILAGGERAYLFDKNGNLLKRHDAREAGLHNKGTSTFSEQIIDGKRIVVAHRPRYDGTENIPLSYVGEGENRRLADDVVQAQKQRRAIIKRLHSEPQVHEPMVNPRLNDPDVIALKAKRQAAKSLKS